MYRWGHVGASLFCYAPLGAALGRTGETGLAALGVAVAVAVATLPDADERLPIAHRGPTHTVWFVAAAALVSAALGAALGRAIGRPLAVAGAVGSATAVSLTSHLLADSVTPMGIRPLSPVSAWHHSFDLTPAADRRANAALLAAGTTFAAGCLALALAAP
ncbi:metal-dependent hydrolase [Natronomonas sp.]|uniref:metal-dependent hydrolase n=1 Tax=Natronomonas sp. TaxID=2184060 RepID=UPI00262CD762|nr:metal-dependent hydrolase [Natronomonas sp.]